MLRPGLLPADDFGLNSDEYYKADVQLVRHIIAWSRGQH